MKVAIESNKHSSGKNSKLSGTGVSHSTAGIDSKFNLETYDAFGNKGLGGESDDIKLELVLDDETKEVVSGKVKDIGDGVYELSYNAPRSGNYKVNVYVRDELVGEPKDLIVEDSGISDANNTKIKDFNNKIKAGDRFNFFT